MMPAHEEANDQLLIERCRAGEKDAFGALVQRHMKRAYYTALGLVGSHEDACDVSQEAFVRAYRSLSRFDPQVAAFFTWYYSILRNLCFNLLRDRLRRPRPFSEEENDGKSLLQVPDDRHDPTIIAERDEIKDALWRAVSGLREQEREAIVLREFQGLSYKEIACLMDCPVGTVMSLLFAARKQLREKMNGYLS
jgi:RNA polymerase sigma-70 factor, ECF subfamily